MKKDFTIKGYQLMILIVLILGASLVMGHITTDFVHNEEQLKECSQKVKFYERVLEEFGIDEFVYYPELFYEYGYNEQAMVHNCMWAIDDALDWENAYYDCAEKCKCK